MEELNGKIALVTGGGSGIGEGICHGFAEAGASVAVVDRNGDAAARVANEISDHGVRTTAVPFDVTAVEAIDEMLAAVEAEIGQLNVLVNNAGVAKYQEFLDVAPADWDWIHGVNARGAFFMMQRVAARMVRTSSGGSIINITSVAADIPWQPNPAYGPSKAALKHATKFAATALGEHGIRVNNLCPGPTETPLTAQFYDDELRERFLKLLPLSRLGKPEDLANAAVFLASDRSGFTTGSTVYVEGGRLVR